MKKYNPQIVITQKYESGSTEVLFPLIFVFFVVLWLPWRFYQDFQFASESKNTVAEVLRIEEDGRYMIIVEYNDHKTGLPTEGVFINTCLIATNVVPGQRLGILYVSGMYRVYLPECQHPSFNSASLFIIGEVIMLLLGYGLYKRYKDLKAQGK